MTEKQIVIIGGGPAGLAAALRLYEKGAREILILEREGELGGILRQCIHDGFGLTRFKESLSGPEYAQRFIDEIEAKSISYKVNTTVIDISADKVITAVSGAGLQQYKAQAVVLTMGCRERTRGAISIPGMRPAGIYTAGVAQSYVNLHNKMPGNEVVILGSGDIGMIMARRLTLEGAAVKAVFEIQPYPSGLPRNIEQCLNDYDIPLYLGYTIIDMKGKSRLESITVAKVDEKLRPIPGTEEVHSCDTLILSVGLIPENELSLAAGVLLDGKTKGPVVDENYETNVAGIFAAGNVLQVHDLVDFVSVEGERLAEAVCAFLEKKNGSKSSLNIHSGAGIGYTVPQQISGEQDFILSFRVKKPYENATVVLTQGETCIKKISFKKALPAEMIQVSVKKEQLKKNEELEVAVI